MNNSNYKETRIFNNANRPKLHFTPNKGWINDPNGMVWFKGRYHLFYQFNPYHSNWDCMHWGHAVSNDLLHWEETEIVLKPDKPYDDDPEGGCFSGSVVVWKDKLYVFYTGKVVQEGKGKETQCMAVSEDGNTFIKIADNPLINYVPEDGGTDFRDPKVFYGQGKWRMICGGTDGQADNPDSTGRIYLFSSENLFNWEYNGILYEANAGEGSMYECPDMFQLGESWVITASPMYSKDFRSNTYMVGAADFENCIFTPYRSGILDQGTHFYAMQSYPCCKGKIYSIAWLGGWLWMPWINDYGPDEGYRGILSIPRELFIDEEGWLCSKLIEEMDKTSDVINRTESLCTAKRESVDIPFTNQTVYLKLNLDFGEKKHGLLKICFEDEQGNQIYVDLDSQTEILSVNYNNADVHSKFGIRRTNCNFTGNVCDMEILLDNNIFTIFCNHGRYSYTGKMYPEGKVKICAQME